MLYSWICLLHRLYRGFTTSSFASLHFDNGGRGFARGIVMNVPRFIDHVLISSAARYPAGSSPRIPPTTTAVDPLSCVSVMYTSVSSGVSSRIVYVVRITALDVLYVASMAGIPAATRSVRRNNKRRVRFDSAVSAVFCPVIT